MNVYDIESLKNRINLMENELEMLKHWVDLLIKESNKVKIVTEVKEKDGTTRYYDENGFIYDDTVTHNYDDPVYIITD